MIQKKEDYEIRKKAELRSKLKDSTEKPILHKRFTFQIMLIISKSPFAKVEVPSDHLPFQTMLVKIAASMPGHPKRPKFQPKIVPE